jgi:hypothetical protein
MLDSHANIVDECNIALFLVIHQWMKFIRVYYN